MSLADDIFTAANQTRGIPSLLGISESDATRYGTILDIAGNFVNGEGEASPETTVAYQSPIEPDVTAAAPDPEGNPAWTQYAHFLPYVAAALLVVAFVIVAGKKR